MSCTFGEYSKDHLPVNFVYAHAKDTRVAGTAECIAVIVTATDACYQSPG